VFRDCGVGHTPDIKLRGVERMAALMGYRADDLVHFVRLADGTVEV
jgi:hypothetical protein